LLRESAQFRPSKGKCGDYQEAKLGRQKHGYSTLFPVAAPLAALDKCLRKEAKRGGDVLRILDRYLLGIFIRAFLICFFCLVGLCIVIDAFANLDEFSERCSGIFSLLAIMAEYYSYRVSLFFDRLSAIIVTIAAMFTISWIQRTNELTPMLSAGRSVYRVVLPVLLAAMAINGLAMLNQEAIIPSIADRLQQEHDDDGTKVLRAQAVYDERGILLSGGGCYRQTRSLRPAFVTLPPAIAGSVVELWAAEAHYLAPGEGPLSGGWLLVGVRPEPPEVSPYVLTPLDSPGKYFLRTSITFKQVSRRKDWFQFTSTRELLSAMQEVRGGLRAEMAVLVHSRLTRPLAGLTLLFLVLPFVLAGPTQPLVRTMGACIVISIAFKAVTILCQRLGALELIQPAAAAWLPILLFGTVAISLTDMIRT
jgi:lipopolysaccharide export system permease protein